MIAKLTRTGQLGDAAAWIPALAPSHARAGSYVMARYYRCQRTRPLASRSGWSRDLNYHKLLLLHPHYPPPLALVLARASSTSTTSTRTTGSDKKKPNRARRTRTAAPPETADEQGTEVSVPDPDPQSTKAASRRRKRAVKTTVRLADLPCGPLQRLSSPPRPSRVAADPRDAALPQGLVSSPSPPPAIDPEYADNAPAYPTVVLQARRNMDKFPDCVLITRVGGFYELYFEHADEFGPALNLKVASKKTNAGPVPMAGFPFFQLDRHLKMLVQDLGKFVAVAEEFANSADERIRLNGLQFDRRVARIITPGTLIDENFMDPYANNYIMAIHAAPITTAAAAAAAPAAAPPPPPPPPPPDPLAETLSAQALPLGLAWLDLSTGSFYTQCTTLASLSAILSRVSPREVVLRDLLQSAPDHALFSVLAEDRHLITYTPPDLSSPASLHDWTPMLESAVPADTHHDFTPLEVDAGNLVLGYVKDKLRGMSMRLQPPQRREDMHIMAIDKNSMRSLEMKQTVRDAAYKGSLLHAIRRTVTKGGARLLSDWLSSPSTSIDVIRARQDLVTRFIQDPHLRDSIIMCLHRSHDSQRLVQKFTLGKGDPDDLLALAQTIHATVDVVALLQDAQATESDSRFLASMKDRIDLAAPVALAQRIRDAIDEAGIMHQQELQALEASEMASLASDVIATDEAAPNPVSPPPPPPPGHDGSAGAGVLLSKMIRKKMRTPSIRDLYNDDSNCWTMKPDASPRLEELHRELAALLEEKENLAENLRQRFGATSLTLKSSPNLGHVCHVRGTRDMRSDALAGTKTLSSSRTTRSFHLPEWAVLGQRLDHTRFDIRAEEQRVLHRLRELVVSNLVRLRRNAAVLDELDITTSFAKLAKERNLTRPILNNSTSHLIMGGRHPTVEGGLYEQGRSFVRNDCLVGTPDHGRLWLITGPNMAGKSTFLRQNALITILAQVGCYVPADYSEIGIVDAIFSRVGSADNLFRDQSTFMVEMLETAQILRNATEKSFVIMDEIGRGTTPQDGSAVAFASLHHLATVNRCRTLFATHFHVIADLVSAWGLHASSGGAVETYCNNVEEDRDGSFVYIHRLRKGVNQQSHALKVAGMAGLPSAAMETARKVLEQDGASPGGLYV